MGKFNVGDLVVATKEMRTFCEDSVIKKGDKGIIEEARTTFIGRRLVGVKFKNFYGFCPENNLEKINEEPKMEEKKDVKFNFGDKVRAKHDIENMIGSVKKGSIGTTVLSDPRHKEWSKILFGKELYTFDFDGITVHTDSEDVEKLETSEPEFKVGDRVKVDENFDYEKSYVLQDVRGLFGTVGEVFDQATPPYCRVNFDSPGVLDWFIAYTGLEKISEEKPQTTETPKKEKKLERITITLKNRQSAIVIISSYVSADAEFVYYESRDGKTYEIREDEIIMIVSEEFNDD